MSLSKFTDRDAIDSWTSGLDQEWPERIPVSKTVIHTLTEWLRKDICRLKPLEKIRILELGIGTGQLANTVLDNFAAIKPGLVEYIGIDIEPALIRNTKEKLVSAGHRNIQFFQTDLKDYSWIDKVHNVHAVFSLQTFHDLGGVDALEKLYREIYHILFPGGILVNADFVIPFKKDNPVQPRRLPIEIHHNLLSRLNFFNFKCEIQAGKMACMSAQRC